MGFAFTFISSLLFGSAVLAAQYTVQPRAGVWVELMPTILYSAAATLVVPKLSCGQGTVYAGITLNRFSICSTTEAGVALTCDSTTAADAPIYRAYSWAYPDDPVFWNISIREGDKVRISLDQLATGGVNVMFNDTGALHHTPTGHMSANRAQRRQTCGKKVQWSAKTEERGGYLLPIPEFDDITLTDIIIFDKNNSMDGWQGKDWGILNMTEANGFQLAEASVKGDSVTITFAVPPDDVVPPS